MTELFDTAVTSLFHLPEVLDRLTAADRDRRSAGDHTHHTAHGHGHAQAHGIGISGGAPVGIVSTSAEAVRRWGNDTATTRCGSTASR